MSGIAAWDDVGGMHIKVWTFHDSCEGHRLHESGHLCGGIDAMRNACSGAEVVGELSPSPSLAAHREIVHCIVCRHSDFVFVQPIKDLLHSHSEHVGMFESSHLELNAASAGELHAIMIFVLNPWTYFNQSVVIGMRRGSAVLVHRDSTSSGTLPENANPARPRALVTVHEGAAIFVQHIGGKIFPFRFGRPHPGRRVLHLCAVAERARDFPQGILYFLPSVR